MYVYIGNDPCSHCVWQQEDGSCKVGRDPEKDHCVIEMLDSDWESE